MNSIIQKSIVSALKMKVQIPFFKTVLFKFSSLKVRFDDFGKQLQIEDYGC